MTYKNAKRHTTRDSCWSFMVQRADGERESDSTFELGSRPHSTSLPAYAYAHLQQQKMI